MKKNSTYLCLVLYITRYLDARYIRELDQHVSRRQMKPSADFFEGITVNGLDDVEVHIFNHEEPESPGSTTPVDIHGGIQMGSQIKSCDTGKDNLWVDWDNSTEVEYTCVNNESRLQFSEEQYSFRVECLNPEDVPMPMHTCLSNTIVYDDIPPRGGSHRPNWPVWGEYLYCPPQRWVHSLEHGAAVFLYHPCADPEQIDRLRRLARTCLRKHVITPYRPLGVEMPFAVVTWGCRIVSNYFDETAITQFIRAYAQQTTESVVPRDGVYDLGLLRRADVVSDLDESTLCPMVFYDADHMNNTFISDDKVSNIM